MGSNNFFAQWTIFLVLMRQRNITLQAHCWRILQVEYLTGNPVRHYVMVGTKLRTKVEANLENVQFGHFSRLEDVANYSEISTENWPGHPITG